MSPKSTKKKPSVQPETIAAAVTAPALVAFLEGAASPLAIVRGLDDAFDTHADPACQAYDQLFELFRNEYPDLKRLYDTLSKLDDFGLACEVPARNAGFVLGFCYACRMLTGVLSSGVPERKAS